MTVLEYFASHSAISDPGRHAELLRALPDDIEAIAKIVQGLCIHDFVAGPMYGFDVPASRAGEIHTRGAEAMLDCILAIDPRPLGQARPPEKRLVSRCHLFALLFVSTLRSKGIPARVRGGFAAYFNPPRFEDHWVGEYWDARNNRWVLADPQPDAVWMERLHHAFDPLDLSADEFLTSPDAWQRCRRGAADPGSFGVSAGGLAGLWFVASSLVRDLAGLNKVEMLPWDVWGAQPQLNAKPGDDAIQLFDRVADLTIDPDTNFGAIRSLYRDERLKVPGEVFNAVAGRPERVAA
jgi:hypothetical protein